MKIELPLQRELNSRGPRRPQNDEKTYFFEELYPGRVPRPPPSDLREAPRQHQHRRWTPKRASWELFGTVFDAFGGAVSEVVFGSFYLRRLMTRGGLGEAPGASNLRVLKGPIAKSHTPAPPSFLGGAANPAGFARFAVAMGSWHTFYPANST